MDLSNELILSRCPHCGVDQPNLRAVTEFTATAFNGYSKQWVCYACARCAGVVTAWAPEGSRNIEQIYPGAGNEVDEALPERAREYLQQAMGSVSAPAGAVMLAASAVDAMLKAKDLTEGTLYRRINMAVDQNLITHDMAEWAHEVRLDANDQRHADVEAQLPSTEDARRVLDFVHALGEIMFVLPMKIRRGREGAE